MLPHPTPANGALSWSGLHGAAFARACCCRALGRAPKAVCRDWHAAHVTHLKVAGPRRTTGGDTGNRTPHAARPATDGSHTVVIDRFNKIETHNENS